MAVPKVNKAVDLDPIEMLVQGYRDLQQEEKALAERKKSWPNRSSASCTPLRTPGTPQGWELHGQLEGASDLDFSDDLTALINA